ncbi:MAG: lipoprotein transporter permease [Rhodoglobus sp.]|nr:lipoprotein transporter permease [Rhodoglobus sp.]
MVTGMCAAILLTTGRTVGAEEAVLGSIDSVGTRSIVIRADTDSGLDTSVLQRLASIEGIEWASAFGPPEDVVNAAIPDGPRVPIRMVWSDDLPAIGIPTRQALPNHIGWASASALSQLGMPDGIGGVTSTSGGDFAIAGEIAVPDYLQFLEPLVLVPKKMDIKDPQTVSVVVVIATRPDLVASVSKAVQSVLGVKDPNKVKIATSEELASLRALVQGQLGTFGRGLVIFIFGVTAILVAAILYGLVMLRRKDFGRRRALGASQRLIVALLLTQMAGLSAVGAALGTIIAEVSLAIGNDPLPSLSFTLSVGLLAVGVGTLAALVPAILASRRDPLKELRVP